MRPTLILLILLIAFPACRPSEPEGGAAPATPATGTAAPQPAATPEPSPPPPPLETGAQTPAPAEPVPGTSAANLPTDRKLQAAILVVDGVFNTELAAPYDVLQHTAYHVKPGIQVFTVSPDGRPVTTYEGLKLSPDYSFANAPAADILVVPSTSGSMEKDLRNQPLIDWVRTAGNQARHVLSLCDGAFVLAQAGLLETIPATTFPKDYERFQKSFPKVDLRVNVSFVDAGKVITSEGGARSYEAAMQLVNKLYGPEVAKGIGEGLLVSWPPDPELTPRIVETPPPPVPTVAPPAPAAPGP